MRLVLRCIAVYKLNCNALWVIFDIVVPRFLRRWLVFRDLRYRIDLFLEGKEINGFWVGMWFYKFYWLGWILGRLNRWSFLDRLSVWFFSFVSVMFESKFLLVSPLLHVWTKIFMKFLYKSFSKNQVDFS